MINKGQNNQHNSIWISANAGSGKTTFLTRRLVTLLLGGVQPERICCITYTKAAASEMQSRVLGLLRRLLLASAEECAAQVSELLGRPASQADIARARSLFGLVLDSSSGGLQLTTIHGFCQSILRRFPLEADIAPHFTVLDDAAAASLLTRAKHRLLGQYSGGSARLDEAFDLIGSRGSEARFDGYIGAIIKQRGMWDAIWRSQTPELLRARLFQFHGLSDALDEQALTDDFCAILSEADIATIRRHLPQLSSHKNQAEQKMARILSDWLAAEASARPAMVADFCDLFLTKEGVVRKRILGKDFPETAPLAQLCARLAVRAEAYHQQLAALASAQESYAVALLAQALLDLYAQAKMAVHALDYDDLIGKTRALFANPAMLGWVMSKLDHRIDHLLIDEAQDTSGEQWSIAHLLVEELIAANEGVGSGDVPRSLLVVGDEKQSIYSFQGAAPELFASKQGEFETLLAHSMAPLSYTELTTSYRSAEAVLTLVDHVAQMPEIALALTARGTSELHQLKRHEAAGSVTLYPAIPAPENETLPPLTLPTDYPLLQSAAQLLADGVAEMIGNWLEQGRLLESEGRPISPGDILILVYRRKPIVLPLIRALQQRKIPVAGLDRLVLSEHLAVRDLLALMRWVMNPQDDLSLAHVLRSPLIGYTDEALRGLCFERTGSLWSNLCTHPLLDRALAERAMSPYDFLTDLLETGDARRRFAARFGEEVHEVLDELKAQAAAMPADRAPTLANFYDWISGSTQQIKREQEGGASQQIRIMTVHGAKGLEAPVVLLVDTVKVPDTKDEKIFFVQSAEGQSFPLLAISDDAKRAPALLAAKQKKSDALLNEYYRLLYVALTRARDELHIFGTANRQGVTKERSWYSILDTALRSLGEEDDNGMLQLKDQRPAIPPKSLREATALHTKLPDWALAAPARSTPKTIHATPSQLVPGAYVSAYAQSGSGNARARGVRIHRMLEFLSVAQDVESLHPLVTFLAPDWSASEQEKTAADLLHLRTNTAWIWESPAHAEVNICGTIAMHGREIAITGQIDRLIELPHEIVILDYKTGQHVPASQNEISENYRVQLKTYHALVSRLYPQKTIRCAILWTATPQLMWCDETVNATQWPNQIVMEQAVLVA